MKTTYERFIEANNRLAKCYEGTPMDKWNKLSTAAQDALCIKESNEVAEILRNNQVDFKHLLQERLQAMGDGSSNQ